jgi:hypothetical protein
MTRGNTMQAAIGYLRVSTQEQGRSGLGLAAQRDDIEVFGAREGFRVKAWFQDIQTSAGRDALLLRPGLATALKEARARRCPLIVSRLDRVGTQSARKRGHADLIQRGCRETQRAAACLSDGGPLGLDFGPTSRVPPRVTRSSCLRAHPRVGSARPCHLEATSGLHYPATHRETGPAIPGG